MRELYVSENRIVYIDILKGIGILLLLLSHSFYFPSVINNWIFSFHMPLFFVCSGVLFAVQYSDSENLHDKLQEFIMWKCLRIGIPFIIFSLAIILYQVGVSILSGSGVDTADITEKIWRIIRLQGMESLWFLPCLLIAEIIFAIVHVYFPRRGKIVLTIICFIICLIFNRNSSSGGLGVLPRSSCGYIFMHMGFAMHNKQLLQKSKLSIIITCLLVGMLLSVVNGFAAIGSFDLGNPVLFFISAALTLFALSRICQMVHQPGLLPWFGQNSIVILCTNNILIEVLRLLDYKLTGSFFLSTGYIGVFLFATILTILEIPIIMFSMKYLRVLFGVIRKKREVRR